MRTPFRAYALAMAALVAAVALRWLLDPVMGDTLPLVTLFGAVAAAVVGRRLPRRPIVVAVLGYLACDYLFIQPRGALGLDDLGNVVGLVAYLFTCALIIGFGEAMRLRAGARQPSAASCCGSRCAASATRSSRPTSTAASPT